MPPAGRRAARGKIAGVRSRISNARVSWNCIGWLLPGGSVCVAHPRHSRPRVMIAASSVALQVGMRHQSLRTRALKQQQQLTCGCRGVSRPVTSRGCFCDVSCFQLPAPLSSSPPASPEVLLGTLADRAHIGAVQPGCDRDFPAGNPSHVLAARVTARPTRWKSAARSTGGQLRLPPCPAFAPSPCISRRDRGGLRPVGRGPAGEHAGVLRLGHRDTLPE